MLCCNLSCAKLCASCEFVRAIMRLQCVKSTRFSVRCVGIRNHLITISTGPEERRASGVSCANAATRWITSTHLCTSPRASHTGFRFLQPITQVPASLAPLLADSIRAPPAGGLAMGVSLSKPRGPCITKVQTVPFGQVRARENGREARTHCTSRRSRTTGAVCNVTPDAIDDGDLRVI